MDSTNTWNDDYQHQQNKIARLKEIYYDFENKLALPYHSRCYYDYLSSQFTEKSINDKLRDLGFLVTNGFDLQVSVQSYKEDRPELIISSVHRTFMMYILYMRYEDYHHFTSELLLELSELEIIQLFIDEVKLRYDNSEHQVNISTWKPENVIELAKGDKETFRNLVFSVDLTKKYI